MKILALFRRIPGIDPKNLGYYIAEIYIMLYSCRKIGEFWENILKNVEKSRLVLSFKLNIIGSSRKSVGKTNMEIHENH